MKTTVLGKSYNHITLPEIKKQTKVHPNFLDDDGELEALLKVATEVAEQYVHGTIALTTYQTTLKDFTGSQVKINTTNFVDVTSVVYTDASGNSITLAEGSGYTVDIFSNHFVVEFPQSIVTDSLVINHESGFTDITIPATIKQAILIRLTDLYDVERSTYISGSFQLNKAFENLLNHYKKFTIY